MGRAGRAFAVDLAQRLDHHLGDEIGVIGRLPAAQIPLLAQRRDDPFGRLDDIALTRHPPARVHLGEIGRPQLAHRRRPEDILPAGQGGRHAVAVV